MVFFNIFVFVLNPLSNLKFKTMNIKKKSLGFALAACISLMSFSCTTSNTAEDDSLYEQNIDILKIKVPANGIDILKVKVPKNG